MNKPIIQAEHEISDGYIINWPTEPTQQDMLMYELEQKQKGKPK